MADNRDVVNNRGRSMPVKFPTKECRAPLEEGEICLEKLADSSLVLEYFRRRLKEIRNKPASAKTIWDAADETLIVPVYENDLDGPLKLSISAHHMIYYSDAVIMRLLQLGRPGTPFDVHKRATFEFRDRIGSYIGLREVYDWNGGVEEKELKFISDNQALVPPALLYWIASRKMHVAPMSITNLHQLLTMDGARSDFYSREDFWKLHSAQPGDYMARKLATTGECVQKKQKPNPGEMQCTPMAQTAGLVRLITKDLVPKAKLVMYDCDASSKRYKLTLDQWADRACIQKSGIMLHSSYLWANSDKFINMMYEVTYGGSDGSDEKIQRYAKICRMINQQDTYVAPESWFPLSNDQVKAYLRYAVLLDESTYTKDEQDTIAQSFSICKDNVGRDLVTLHVNVAKLDRYPVEFLRIFARCAGIFDGDRLKTNPAALKKAIAAISDQTPPPLEVKISTGPDFKMRLAMLQRDRPMDFGEVDIDIDRNYSYVSLRRDKPSPRLLYEVIYAFRKKGVKSYRTNFIPEIHTFTDQYYNGFLKYLQYINSSQQRD